MSSSSYFGSPNGARHLSTFVSGLIAMLVAIGAGNAIVGAGGSDETGRPGTVEHVAADRGMHVAGSERLPDRTKNDGPASSRPGSDVSSTPVVCADGASTCEPSARSDIAAPDSSGGTRSPTKQSDTEAAFPEAEPAPRGGPGSDPPELRLATVNDIYRGFVGAFKIVHSDDMSDSTYANGRIAYDPDRESVYIDSHRYQDAIGEFAIPGTLSTSKDTDALPIAQPLQDFTEILDRAPTGNPQGIDELGGMAYVDGELVVQAYEYYDAPADNTHTTVVVRDPGSLATSAVDGFYSFEGAAHTVSYISPIPSRWQEVLGGPYVAGNGHGMPILGRLSAGPSLYAFDPANLVGGSGTVPTHHWMSYLFSEALSITRYPHPDGSGRWDGYNETGTQSGFAVSNDLWTQSSAARFGFVVPGTRTFAVIGESGMHESGGGYKIRQIDGNLCGGPCPYDPDDEYPYYWLYDLHDIIGTESPSAPEPYEYGKFDNRFPDGFPSAGAFDPASGTLLLLNRSAARAQFGGHPVVSVYRLPTLFAAGG